MQAALFFDVDGTLVPTFDPNDPGFSFMDLKPSPAVYDAFRRLRERGHKPFICTGRTLSTIGPELHDLNPVGIVSGAGSCVSIDGEVLYEATIPHDLLEESAKRFLDLGIETVLEANDLCVALTRPGEVYTDIPGIDSVHSIEELRAAVGDTRFEKCAFLGDDIPVFEREGEFFHRHFTLCNLGSNMAEISLKGVDKGAGVRRALEVLGEGPWQTFGFGDSENDRAMLGTVDVAVAMGNALPGIKEIADYVTLPVSEEGVPAALEHFGLI